MSARVCDGDHRQWTLETGHEVHVKSSGRAGCELPRALPSAFRAQGVSFYSVTWSAPCASTVFLLSVSGRSHPPHSYANCCIALLLATRMGPQALSPSQCNIVSTTPGLTVTDLQ